MTTYSDLISASITLPTPYIPGRDPIGSAVIFDLDDTLILTAPHWKHAETTLLKRLGHPWSEELSLQYKGMNLPDIAATLHRKFRPELSVAECRNILRNALLESLRHGPVLLMPGALECLARARAVAPLAIVSGSPMAAIELILYRTEITHLFK
ncbi:MAG TPA: HAD family phosphatase, partial [Chthoniobacteraceae bacterium]|nr:HAD family phosphatase [Chthoniobacteraceae bacterium]